MLPFLILKSHTLYFDGVINAIQNSSYQWGDTYNLININGHWISAYPIVTPVILLPVYIIHLLILVVFPGSYEFYSVISKSSAVLIMSFAVVFFYMVCEKLFAWKTALFTTVVFAFGTISWAISSQSLWQHGTSELLLVVILLCIVRNETNQDIKNFIIMGIASGLFVFNRPPDAIILLPVLYYLWLNRKMLPAFLCSGIISGFPFLIYNILATGSIFGGYAEMVQSHVTDSLNGIPILNHIGVLLISPNRGLFVYSPILILSFLGVYVLYKKSGTVRNVLLSFIPAIILLILVYSSHLDGLGGGWTYGPRYLTAALPILCIYTGYGVQKYNYKTIKALIAVLLIISIFIEIIGAFCYPYTDWYAGKDATVRSYVWDMNDSLIVNSFWSYNKIESVTLMIWPTLPPPMGYVVVWKKG